MIKGSQQTMSKVKIDMEVIMGLTKQSELKSIARDE